MRWTRENDFDSVVRAAHDSFLGRVPIEVIKAVIATESSFIPSAMPPSQQADVSAGLMQMTLSTAHALGYPGELGDPQALTGLFTPGTNVYLGTKLLDQLRGKVGEDWEAVYSAYNGGYRPSLGFGARVTRTTTICLARDKQGNCLRSYTAQPGQFGNQPNVDRFKSALAYFQRNPPAPPGEAQPPATEPGPGGNTTTIALLVLALGGLLVVRGMQ